jgi:hypothetical protein
MASASGPVDGLQKKGEIADAEMEILARNAEIVSGSCGITRAMVVLYMHALSVSYAVCTSSCGA